MEPESLLDDPNVYGRYLRFITHRHPTDPAMLRTYFVPEMVYATTYDMFETTGASLLIESNLN